MYLTFEKMQKISIIYPRECKIDGVIGNDEADLATVDPFIMVRASGT